ncbi:MAG: hypothetical protein U5P10_01890 [Spirochaetia bacterium]|nr:hypothetical protein [Spirochaetia bacterium]
MSIDTESIRRRKAELLQPQALDNLKELEKIVEPKPHYVGPGPWLKAIQAAVKAADHTRGGRNVHS